MRPKTKPKMARAWKAQPLRERLYDCVFLLQVQDVLTDTEALRIKRRMEKAEKRGEYEGGRAG